VDGALEPLPDAAALVLAGGPLVLVPVPITGVLSHCPHGWRRRCERTPSIRPMPIACMCVLHMHCMHGPPPGGKARCRTRARPPWRELHHAPDQVQHGCAERQLGQPVGVLLRGLAHGRHVPVLCGLQPVPQHAGQPAVAFLQAAARSARNTAGLGTCNAAAPQPWLLASLAHRKPLQLRAHAAQGKS